VRRPLADPESIFVGLRQSRGRVSIRNVFGLCKCRRNFDLEITTDFSTTGCRAFDRASFCPCDWCISARSRSRFFGLVIDFCRADWLVKRLDHLLGGYRLVRCARGIHLVAMGVVGSGTCPGFAANKMAVPLAGALRLSPRYRWISLHSSNAAASHCMVGNEDNVVPTNRETPRRLG